MLLLYIYTFISIIVKCLRKYVLVIYVLNILICVIIVIISFTLRYLIIFIHDSLVIISYIFDNVTYHDIIKVN